MLVTLITLTVYAVGGQRPVGAVTALLRLIGSGLLGLITLPLVSRCMNTLKDALPKRKGYGWQ
jgi:hypothetical protein